jgi:hypothetical protein
MWKLKNSDEYCVFASNKQHAIIEFKKKLGLEVKGYMIEKAY